MGPLPHSGHRMDSDHRINSIQYFLLSSLFHVWPLALFITHYSNPALDAELLISSWAFLWHTSLWYLSASQTLISLFSLHPCEILLSLPGTVMVTGCTDHFCPSPQA